MTDLLADERATDADGVFRNFMRDNLRHAIDHYRVTVTAAPTFGWRLKTISAPVVQAGGQQYWLRVLSQETQWAHDHDWTGNHDANVITGFNKPYVVDVFEWSEGQWREQRAELMTTISGTVCSPTDVLRHPPNVTEDWWSQLNNALQIVAAVPTDRARYTQDEITTNIHERFGTGIDTTVTAWETAHGDLHWANLTYDDFAILDWELWGQAPTGTDPATLWAYSLHQPDTAEHIQRRYADVLNTPTGRITQLTVIARLLRRIDGGDYPDLREPLVKKATSLLGQASSHNDTGTGVADDS